METNPAENAQEETTVAEESAAEESTATPEPKVKRGTITYAVNPETLEVRSYRGRPILDETKEIAVLGKEQMGRLSTPLLVKLYNRVRPEKPITKFRDRKAAEKTMWDALEVLAPKPLPGNTTMPAAAKKSARKSAAKKSTTTAKKAGGAGRTSAFSGKTITKLVDKNPRREGTHGFNSFALIKNGMTYEQYVEKGGRRNDLQWDVDHKFVKVS